MPHRMLLEGTLFPNGTGNVEKLTNVSVEYSAEGHKASQSGLKKGRSRALIGQATATTGQRCIPGRSMPRWANSPPCTTVRRD